MPTAYRKKKVEWTIENLKLIYGDGSGSSTGNTREVTPADVRKPPSV